MLYVGPELLMPLASAAVAAAGAVLMFGRRVMDRLRAAGSTLRRLLGLSRDDVDSSRPTPRPTPRRDAPSEPKPGRRSPPGGRKTDRTRRRRKDPR